MREYSQKSNYQIKLVCHILIISLFFATWYPDNPRVFPTNFKCKTPVSLQPDGENISTFQDADVMANGSLSNHSRIIKPDLKEGDKQALRQASIETGKHWDRQVLKIGMGKYSNNYLPPSIDLGQENPYSSSAVQPTRLAASGCSQLPDLKRQMKANPL